VMRVDTVHVTNVYVNRTVIVNNESHVAFNGGEGGIAARPTPQEQTFAREPHQAALAAQTSMNMLPARTAPCSHRKTTARLQSRPRLAQGNSADTAW
jgi:hypothetical protein